MCLARSQVRARVYLSWRGEEFLAFKHAFRVAFPTHADCVFSTMARAWSLPLAAAPRLRQWLDQTVEPDALDWPDEPSSGSRSYSRSQSSDRHHRGETQTLAQATAHLYLMPTAPAWACEAVYRAALKRCHPDTGGEHSTTVALNEATAIIRSHQQESSDP